MAKMMLLGAGHRKREILRKDPDHGYIILFPSELKSAAFSRVRFNYHIIILTGQCTVRAALGVHPAHDTVTPSLVVTVTVTLSLVGMVSPPATLVLPELGTEGLKVMVGL